MHKSVRALLTFASILCVGLISAQDIAGIYKLSGLNVVYYNIARTTTPIVVSDIYGIGITTPANARPAAFQANYGDADRIWRWKHIQRRLVERIIVEYRGREDEGIFLIPAHLGLDNVSGFPSNNAVHPNATGYNQMGDSFYAWLKWRLEKRAKQPAFSVSVQ